jgi:hypothetical protein
MRRRFKFKSAQTCSQTGTTWRELFTPASDASTLMFTAHFPSPSTGQVVRRGDGFGFVSECLERING